MYRVLIVEDDQVIASMIRKSLQAWGLQVQLVENFQDVAGCFRVYQPHLVLMDISLPYYNGYYWCSEIRKISKVLIIFISSRADNMDVVMAVNMGGDDYIAKPVAMDVLIAKIQAMLRRSYDYELKAAQPALRDAVLQAASSCLVRGEESIELTKNELRIMQLLLSHKGQIVSREQIMLALWDSDEFVDDNTLSVNVNRLRRKLEAAGLGGCITTHKGQGYSIHE